MKITGIICCLALLCTACSEEKTELPWGSDNYIVSFSLTTGADTYPAVIRDGRITVSIPYNVGRRAGILRIMRARLDLPRPGDCRRLGPGVAVSGQLLRQSKRPHLPLYGRAHRHCDRWQSDTSDAGRSGRFRPERNQHRRRQPHHRRRGRRKPRHESGRVEKPRFGPLRPDDHRRLYG